MSNTVKIHVYGYTLSDLRSKAKAEAEKFFGTKVESLELVGDAHPSFGNREGTYYADFVATAAKIVESPKVRKSEAGDVYEVFGEWVLVLTDGKYVNLNPKSVYTSLPYGPHLVANFNITGYKFVGKISDLLKDDA